MKMHNLPRKKKEDLKNLNRVKFTRCTETLTDSPSGSTLLKSSSSPYIQIEETSSTDFFLTIISEDGCDHHKN